VATNVSMDEMEDVIDWESGNSRCLGEWSLLFSGRIAL